MGLRTLLILVAGLTCATAAPAESDVGSPADGEAGSIGFYFLVTPTRPTGHARLPDIDRMELEPEPWLSTEDISFYDTSTHLIYLRGEREDYLEGLSAGGTSRFFGAALRSRSFVLMAGGERCYMGSFHTMVSSSIPSSPHIAEASLWASPSDVLPISWAGMGVDVRNHPALEEALRRHRLLHRGLAVELENVRVTSSEAEGATVTATVTVTNLDEDALYVLDPDKMGAAFHGHSWGVELRQKDDPSVYIFKSSTRRDAGPWNMGWLTRLASGASMKRDLSKTTEHVPPGVYAAYLRFPGVQVGAGQRQRPDGRVWMGSVRSNDLEVVVTR